MQFLLHVIAMIGISTPHILGWGLIFGKGKILHFGPLGSSIIAAYSTFLVTMTTGSFLVGLGVGLFSVLITAAFFTWLSLRMEPDGFGVISIAVHLGLLAIVLNWNSLTRGALGIPRVPRFPFLDSTADFALLGVCMAVLWTVALWWIGGHSLGRALAALSEHEWHAKSLGIDRRTVHGIAFVIGGIGSLLTNVLYHQYIFLVHPSDFAFPTFIFFVTVIVAGRPGSAVGGIVSLVLLSLLREGIRFLPLPPEILGPVRLMLFGAILFAAVWWRRDALFPKPRSV